MAWFFGLGCLFWVWLRFGFCFLGVVVVKNNGLKMHSGASLNEPALALQEQFYTAATGHQH